MGVFLLMFYMMCMSLLGLIIWLIVMVVWLIVMSWLVDRKIVGVLLR